MDQLLPLSFRLFLSLKPQDRLEPYFFFFFFSSSSLFRLHVSLYLSLTIVKEDSPSLFLPFSLYVCFFALFVESSFASFPIPLSRCLSTTLFFLLPRSYTLSRSFNLADASGRRARVLFSTSLISPSGGPNRSSPPLIPSRYMIFYFSYLRIYHATCIYNVYRGTDKIKRKESNNFIGSSRVYVSNGSS